MSGEMTIPEIRARLYQIARRLRHHLPLTSEELIRLADATKRRAPVRRSPVKCRRITKLLAERIAAYAAAHPDASQQEIAVEFHVNAGRVSEILAGKRGE